jgi:hypothetical protein
MLSLNDRVRQVVVTESPERGRPKFLEERTNLPAQSWKKFLEGRQRASLDMAEAVCREWPEYAFWISTGLTDVEHGHVSAEGMPPLVEPMEEVVEQSKRYFRQQRQGLPSLAKFMEPAAEGPFVTEDDTVDVRLGKQRAWYRQAADLVLTSPGVFEQIAELRRLRVTEISSQRLYFDELYKMPALEVMERNQRKRARQA